MLMRREHLSDRSEPNSSRFQHQMRSFVRMIWNLLNQCLVINMLPNQELSPSLRSRNWVRCIRLMKFVSLSEAAHSMGMYVYLDGARIANATAALGGTRETLRAFTRDAGVDAMTFGCTKAGGIFGEAVVFFNPTFATRSVYVRKQVTQLHSKMRFIAAQYEAMLRDDLFITLGGQANKAARYVVRQNARHCIVATQLCPSGKQHVSHHRQRTTYSIAGMGSLLRLGHRYRSGSLDDRLGRDRARNRLLCCRCSRSPGVNTRNWV